MQAWNNHFKFWISNIITRKIKGMDPSWNQIAESFSKLVR